VSALPELEELNFFLSEPCHAHCQRLFPKKDAMDFGKSDCRSDGIPDSQEESDHSQKSKQSDERNLLVDPRQIDHNQFLYRLAPSMANTHPKIGS